jgi:hypothetical protein
MYIHGRAVRATCEVPPWQQLDDCERRRHPYEVVELPPDMASYGRPVRPRPASTSRVWPVTGPERSEARKRTEPATSAARGR